MNNLLPRTREAKKQLRIAKNAYARSNTYHNALAIQKAQKELDLAAEEERKGWFVLDGDEGDFTESELAITVSALREIVGRCKEIASKDLPTSITYVQKVAEQALKTVGYGE